jgi:hypothetical protein
MEMIFESSSCYLFVQFASCCGEFKQKKRKKSKINLNSNVFEKKKISKRQKKISLMNEQNK